MLDVDNAARRRRKGEGARSLPYRTSCAILAVSCGVGTDRCSSTVVYNSRKREPVLRRRFQRRAILTTSNLSIAQIENFKDFVEIGISSSPSID